MLTSSPAGAWAPDTSIRDAGQIENVPVPSRARKQRCSNSGHHDADRARYRFGFALPENALLRRQAKSRLYVHVDDESFPHLGADHLRKLVAERAPWFQAEIKDVAWSIGVRFETRLAERFGAHRTWLAGDAAHLASPIGVHSMNHGIEEACAYAEAIGGALRGESLAGLEKVGKRLRLSWEALQAKPDVADDAPAWAKPWASRIPSCIPASGDHMQALLAQVGLSLG